MVLMYIVESSDPDRTIFFSNIRSNQVCKGDSIEQKYQMKSIDDIEMSFIELCLELIEYYKTKAMCLVIREAIKQ